jgi:hypothetical protein
MATRPFTNAGPPVLTGTDCASSTRYLFVRRPLCFHDATVVLTDHTQFRPFLRCVPILPTRDPPDDLAGLPGARVASPGANLSLLRSWRTTYQAGIRSRIPRFVPLYSRSRRIAVCSSSQTILVDEVIQEMVAVRAGQPEHEAGVFTRHRIERYPVEARPGTEQELHQLARADRAGTQTIIPVAYVKPGLFLEAEHRQGLTETRHAYGKRVRRSFRASTRNPEPRKPSHRCHSLLPTTPTQYGYDRSSNLHY